MSLGDDLVEVLAIQQDRTSDPNDPIMRRRKELVERRIPEALEEMLRPVEPTWKAEGSGGKGAPAEVPWTRIFDPELSARAGIGWYAVYLFSATGDAVYLSLNQGTTTWNAEKDDFDFRTAANLSARVESARRIIRASSIARSTFEPIELKGRQRLGRAYEAGNVHAIRYLRTSMPSSRVLENDLRQIGELLELLYECELRGIAFDDPEELDETVLARIPASSADMPTLAGTEGNSITLPSVTDDGIDGPDRLGIDADARALAAVIAAKQVVPPLAIALYGEWGSGKTYFMHRIEQHIRGFGRRDIDGEVFEPGTWHIRFGAWHYERGHLMVSLHRQIFQALDGSESRDAAEVAAADDRITELETKIDNAEIEIEKAESKREELGGKIEVLREEQESELEVLRSISGKQIMERVGKDPELKKRLDELFRELNLPDVQKSALQLYQAAHEMQAVGKRIAILGGPGRRGLLFSPLVAAAAIMVLAFLGAVVLVGVVPALRPMGSAIGLAASLIGGLATAVTRQVALVRHFLQPAEQLQDLIDRQVEEKRTEQQKDVDELELQLKQVDADRALALETKASSQEELEKARQQRDELTPAKFLQRFIAERAGTSEFDEHLGVNARVHHDLFELSERLTEALEDKKSTPRRIVLYIDDLDRCSAATAVAVLEAVHLYLALPHFVVVVGVDHRGLENCLQAVHSDILVNGGVATPSDYLEKIFQLTYTLPTMSADGCRAILNGAIDDRTMTSEREIGSGETNPEDDTGVPGEAVEGAGSPSHDIDPASESSERTVGKRDESVDSYMIRSLEISPGDRAILDLLAPLVATTPRRAKRFLTIYTVVRARLAGVDYDPAGVAILVAALVGAPETLGRALRSADLSTETGVFGQFMKSLPDGSGHPVELARVTALLKNLGDLAEVAMSAVLAQRDTVSPYSIGIADAYSSR
ncbi:P-loop NTPase fold protein [Nocardia sp. JMUB6875]|uniref:MrcB family domain-containing protein n=1 Tax=Nocardia sp. JMUB6875 TaxID=3158170 RepID=UPI0032E7245F